MKVLRNDSQKQSLRELAYKPFLPLRSLRALREIKTVSRKAREGRKEDAKKKMISNTADEGEGDLSLEYWRRVHRNYFEKESVQLGFEFDENSLICCERFKLLYGN